MKRGISEQVWYVPKTAGGFTVLAAVFLGRKTLQCNFYSHLSLQTVFPAIKLPQNCIILNIAFPTHHIYPVWMTILTIWKNMKAWELPKSQFPNCLLNWEYLEVQSKLIFENPNFRSLCELKKHLQVQPKTKIPKYQFWIYWCVGKSHVLI